MASAAGPLPAYNVPPRPGFQEFESRSAQQPTWPDLSQHLQQLKKPPNDASIPFDENGLHESAFENDDGEDEDDHNDDALDRGFFAAGPQNQAWDETTDSFRPQQQRLDDGQLETLKAPVAVTVVPDDIALEIESAACIIRSAWSSNRDDVLAALRNVNYSIAQKNLVARREKTSSFQVPESILELMDNVARMVRWSNLPAKEQRAAKTQFTISIIDLLKALGEAGIHWSLVTTSELEKALSEGLAEVQAFSDKDTVSVLNKWLRTERLRPSQLQQRILEAADQAILTAVTSQGSKDTLANTLLVCRDQMRDTNKRLGVPNVQTKKIEHMGSLLDSADGGYALMSYMQRVGLPSGQKIIQYIQHPNPEVRKDVDVTVQKLLNELGEDLPASDENAPQSSLEHSRELASARAGKAPQLPGSPMHDVQQSSPSQPRSTSATVAQEHRNVPTSHQVSEAPAPAAVPVMSQEALSYFAQLMNAHVRTPAATLNPVTQQLTFPGVANFSDREQAAIPSQNATLGSAAQQLMYSGTTPAVREAAAVQLQDPASNAVQRPKDLGSTGIVNVPSAAAVPPRDDASRSSSKSVASNRSQGALLQSVAQGSSNLGNVPASSQFGAVEISQLNAKIDQLFDIMRRTPPQGTILPSVAQQPVFSAVTDVPVNAQSVFGSALAPPSAAVRSLADPVPPAQRQPLVRQPELEQFGFASGHRPAMNPSMAHVPARPASARRVNQADRPGIPPANLNAAAQAQPHFMPPVQIAQQPPGVEQLITGMAGPLDEDGVCFHGRVEHVAKLGRDGYRAFVNRGTARFPLMEAVPGSDLGFGIAKSLYAAQANIAQSFEGLKPTDIKAVRHVVQSGDKSFGREPVTHFYVQWRGERADSWMSRSELIKLVGKRAVDGPSGFKLQLLQQRDKKEKWFQKCAKQGLHPDHPSEPKPVDNATRAQYPWIFNLGVDGEPAVGAIAIGDGFD